MSKRHALFRASTVLMVAVALGCTVPTGAKKGTGADTAADGIIGGSGLVKGSGAVPAAGLISNNSGGLSGVVRGPAAGLISNNAGSLISNNSGGLISNNSGGLISNNSGGLISNNSGGYRLTALNDNAVPVPNVEVAVYDHDGVQISFESVTTDTNGAYVFKRLKASPPIIYVVVHYQAEGQQVTLMAATTAPRTDSLRVEVDPASTMVAKKVKEMIRTGNLVATSVKQATIDGLRKEVGAVMSARAVVAAAIFDDNKAAHTFDNMVTESKDLRDAIQRVLTTNGTGNVLAKTPESRSPVYFTPPPNAGSPKPSTAPSTAASTGTTTTPDTSGNTTTTPSTAPSPKGAVTTVGQVSGVLSVAVAPATTTLFAATGTNVQSATLTSTSGTATFSTDATTAARAIAFDGTQKYQLTATAIVKPDGSSVTLKNVPAATDLAVVGTTAYVTCQADHTVYKVDLATGNGTLLAGQAGLNGNTDGVGAAAKFSYPVGIAYDAATSSLFVADSGNGKIRQLKLDGTVSTFAGNGNGAATDGTGTAAGFKKPYDITSDGAGTLYVADYGANTIRKLTSAAEVTTIAGGGNLATTDGTGTSASFALPQAIAFASVSGQSALVVSENGGNIRIVTGW